MGLFGLGAPEIAVCIAVAALILGPDKMAGEIVSHSPLATLYSAGPPCVFYYTLCMRYCQLAAVLCRVLISLMLLFFSVYVVVIMLGTSELFWHGLRGTLRMLTLYCVLLVNGPGSPPACFTWCCL